MIYFDITTKRKIKQYSPNWTKIHDHPCHILVIGGSGLRRTNVLLNLMIYQPEIDQIFLFTKDSYEPKYQVSINKCKQPGLKISNIHRLPLNIGKIWMMFTQISVITIQIKKQVLFMLLGVFDDVIANMINKKLN